MVVCPAVSPLPELTPVVEPPAPAAPLPAPVVEPPASVTAAPAADLTPSAAEPVVATKPDDRPLKAAKPAPQSKSPRSATAPLRAASGAAPDTSAVKEKSSLELLGF